MHVLVVLCACMIKHLIVYLHNIERPAVDGLACFGGLEECSLGKRPHQMSDNLDPSPSKDTVSTQKILHGPRAVACSTLKFKSHPTWLVPARLHVTSPFVMPHVVQFCLPLTRKSKEKQICKGALQCKHADYCNGRTAS